MSRFFKSLLYLGQTYITIAPRVLYRCTFSLLLDPRGTQNFAHQVLSATALESDDPVLGSANIVDLLGTGSKEVSIVGSYHTPRPGGTERLLELAVLAHLVRSLRPRLVFEIGTFSGRTTRLLAINSPPDCPIITLDLSPSEVGYDVGADFRDTPEAGRILQVFGDSRTFCFSPWHGQADFVWVDGCHEYEGVRSDTQNALKLCRPGGWIAWHDYWHNAWWGPVTRCLHQLRHEYPGIVHLRGTTIALLQKPA